MTQTCSARRNDAAKRIDDPAQLIDDVCAGRIAISDLSAAEELAIRWWCRNCTQCSVADIQSLIARGHFRHARRARNEHFKKRTIHLYAALMSVRAVWPMKSSHTAEEREHARQQRLRAAFEALKSVGNFNAPARATRFARPKKNGGFRLITSFNWVDKARHYVLKSALTPFANLHASQFMLSHDTARRGPAAVRKALLAALNECGEDSVFMQFDVVDFYGSISHRWIEENLGLDPSIIQKHIHVGKMIIKDKGDNANVRALHEANQRGGQWGIPQGSRVSPLIAEQAMAAVLGSAAVFSEMPLFVWSDNLGMVVPRGMRDDIERLVRDAFASHDAGPFNLTVTSHPVSREFKFLGCWYSKEADGAKAFIPEDVIAGWQNAVGGQLTFCPRSEIDKVEARIRSKLAQWAWCKDAVAAGEELLGLIQSRRECRAELDPTG